MTYIEVSDMIRAFDFPYNYYQFPKGEAPAPPFVVFYYPNSDDFIADNKNYSGIRGDARRKRDPIYKNRNLHRR